MSHTAPTTAAEILALPMRARHNNLTVAQRSWAAEIGHSKEVDEAIDTGDYDTVVRALGTPESVTLTSDGRGVYTSTWCRCRPMTFEAAWVRYERWTPDGRVAHGYACPNSSCRRLTQSG